MKKYPTQEELRELFDYHSDGYLVWKEKNGTSKGVKIFNSRFAGKMAGASGVNSEGRFYYDIRIKSKLFSGASLVFIFHHGRKLKYVYHENGIQSDNRIENLRTSDERIQTNGVVGSTGYFYVSKCLKTGQFFNNNGKMRMFDTAEAAAAYADSESKRIGGLMLARINFSNVNPEKHKSNKRQEKNRNNKTSKFLGVSKHQKKYTAKCAHKYLGVFESQEEAARAYNIAAYKHYGENAVLNDIPDPLGSGF